MSSKIQRTIEDLITRINYLDHCYYVLDAPDVSDEEYDCAFRELRAIEETNPRLIKPYSPTQRVSGGVLAQFNQVPHYLPMLSLNNAINDDEFLAIDNILSVL